MELSDSLLNAYRRQGFMYIPKVFNSREIAALKKETKRIFELPLDTHLIGEDGEFLGTTAMDRVSSLYARLLTDERLLGLANTLLGESLYCHQYKVIVKEPFGKNTLPWHQDFGPWYHHDGMPEPKALSIGVYLDEVSNFNGPITCLSQSHNLGLLEYQVEEVPGTTPIPSLSAETIATLAASGELVAPIGDAGSILVFDCCTAHASGSNISPFPRDLIYISYNRTDNAITRPSRPDHFANQIFDSLKVTKSCKGELVDSL
jgi:ectoine hydroxylase